MTGSSSTRSSSQILRMALTCLMIEALEPAVRRQNIRGIIRF